MREYWWFFLIAILCALLSTQIDRGMARLIKDRKKRIVLFSIFCAAMIVVDVTLLYRALSQI
ncbi:MAG: hypothetical protein E7224_01700 [Clostridiales bacterium]|nr:hypothetical protein [Clostridiales bacterium]